MCLSCYSGCFYLVCASTSCIVSPSSTGNLVISLHKLSLKCLPLVDTIFTSFLSSVNQFLVFKTRSKEMVKLYCKSLVLYAYQIFSLLLCDECALGNFFRVVTFIYEWIESLQSLLSPHNTTPVFVPAPGSGSNLMSKYSVFIVQL